MWLQVLSSAGVAKVRQISRRYFWIEPCVIFFWEGSPLGAFKTPAEISIPKAEQVEIACPVGTNQIKCKTLRHHPSPNNSTYHLPLALAGSQCVDAAGDASCLMERWYITSMNLIAQRLKGGAWEVRSTTTPMGPGFDISIDLKLASKPVALRDC